MTQNKPISYGQQSLSVEGNVLIVRTFQLLEDGTQGFEEERFVLQTLSQRRFIAT